MISFTILQGGQYTKQKKMPEPHEAAQPGPPRPTPQDFSHTEWAPLAEAEPVADVRDLVPRFRAAAQTASAVSDLRSWAVFEALADACSMMLRPGIGTEEPFIPLMVTETFRTPSLDDLTLEMVESCRTIHAETSSAPLRARLADIAWVRARDHIAAKAAVQAYLDVARAVRLPEDWDDMMAPLTRALEIAAQLGRGEDFNAVRAFAEEILNAQAPSEAGIFSADLLSLLLESGRDDAEQFSGISEGIADRVLTAGKYDLARKYYELAARGQERRRDQRAGAEGRRRLLGRVADAYVAQAEAVLPQAHVGPLLAAGHIQKAIEVLRRAAGFRERVEELLARLIEIQKGIPDAMLPYSHSFDATEFAEQARQSVAGKSADEALLAFLMRDLLSDVGKLREAAERRANEYLFLSLFPKVMHNAEGKVVARQGSVRSADPQEREAALRVEMVSDAVRHYEFLGRIMIEPMRQQIILDHAITAADVHRMLQYSPVVPADREMVFTEGLVAGFYGDTMKAAHYLIPQMEHSIRVLLQRSGVRVSTYDQYGIQKELNLNNLLYLPELKEILGEDLVFALQCLLIEKFGPDLRNKLAHGLMSSNEFFTGQVIFLWWLCLRMCFIPVIRQALEERAGTEAAGAGDTNGSADNPDTSEEQNGQEEG